VVGPVHHAVGQVHAALLAVNMQLLGLEVASQPEQVRVREDLAARPLPDRRRLLLVVNVGTLGRGDLGSGDGHASDRRLVAHDPGHDIRMVAGLLNQHAAVAGDHSGHLRPVSPVPVALHQHHLAKRAAVNQFHARQMRRAVAALGADLVDDALGLAGGLGDGIHLLDGGVHGLLGEAMDARLQNRHHDDGMVARLGDHQDTVEFFLLDHHAQIGIAVGRVALEHLLAPLDSVGDQIADGDVHGIRNMLDHQFREVAPAPADADPAKFDFLIGRKTAGNSRRAQGNSRGPQR